MKKKIFGIVALFIIVLLIITMVVILNNNGNNSTSENNNSLISEVKVNNNPKLKETKYIEGLEISNIKLTQNADGSVIYADVNNNSTEILGGFSVKIVLLDENGNEIDNVIGYIPEIQIGNKVNLNVTTTLDIMNVYDIKFIR